MTGRRPATPSTSFARLRVQLAETLETLGLRAAVAGTHPFAIWQEIAVSGGERYQFVYGSMRELARREPTFALHVHVGVADAETAIRVNDRMRVHLPLLLALSANSPFWQGRDSGLASARTPLFQAFPRVGVPRAFGSYEVYAETVDLLIRTEAVPEATFLWWDVRPQPSARHGRGPRHGRADALRRHGRHRRARPVAGRRWRPSRATPARWRSPPRR